MPTSDALGSNVLDLVLQAGPVAKAVLVLLGVFSIVSWALIVDKWWQLRRVRSATVAFVRAYREGRRPSVVLGAAKKLLHAADIECTAAEMRRRSTARPEGRTVAEAKISSGVTATR